MTDDFIGSLQEQLESEHELQDAPPIDITRPITADMMPAQIEAWEARYDAVIADGWMPGEPYVPRLH